MTREDAIKFIGELLTDSLLNKESYKEEENHEMKLFYEGRISGLKNAMLVVELLNEGDCNHVD